MKYFKIIFSVSFLFVLIGCSGGKSNNVDNNNGESEISNIYSNSIDKSDSILDFDSDHNLISYEIYKDGLLEGRSIYYYPGGTPKIVTYYSKGLKNGENIYYDTLNRIFYKDFYYFNLPVGPVIHYDNQGAARRFFFINLNNETLLDIKYKEWSGVGSIYKKVINYVANEIKNGDSSELQLLVYLPRPPKLDFEFSLSKTSLNKNAGYEFIQNVNDTLPFKYLTLPRLLQNQKYVLGVKIYDSILSKSTVVYKEI